MPNPIADAAEAARPRSGEKYVTPQGFTAIRDGVKAGGGSIVHPTEILRKPPWLRAKAPSGAGFQGVKALVKEHRLSTVCEEAKCPNIGECWNAGTATIMLMGAVCTRACRFCAVDTGNPRGWLDPEEPENVARSVELMGLKYVVLTSVDRDDLPDGGAAQSRNRGRGVDARFPGGARRRSYRRGRRARRLRAKYRNGEASHASGARSARGLCANHRRAESCEAASAGGADEDQSDAGPRRNGPGNPRNHGRFALKQGRHTHAWSISAADTQSFERRALRDAG